MNTYPELLDEGRAEQRTLTKLDRGADRAVITLSDSGRLNSLSTGLIVQLQAHLAEIAADPDLRTVVITGEDPAFSAAATRDDRGRLEGNPHGHRAC
ncbi:MAG: enoyl-CoA hydratase-related protein [Thermoleophilaceae bacterium]